VPTPSKFRAETRKRVLEILSAGGSRREAARAAGIDPSQLSRWLKRGRTASPEGRWGTFYRAVVEAEAHPTLRALEQAHARVLEDPVAALRFLERSEPEVWGRNRPGAAPIVIQLEWPPPALPGDEDGEWDEDDD
jgi:transposase-like protein